MFKKSENSVEFSECIISCENRQPCTIDFRHNELGCYSFEGKDLFDAFCALRAFLEKESWHLLCNGARIDAYPSPMGRNMSGGTKLYVQKIGKRAGREDLVYIFHRAEPELVGTVEEQLSYHEKWQESIKMKEEN